MALTVVGIFDNASEAQKAIDQLVDEGFSRSNIDLSANTGTSSQGSDELIPDRHVNTSGTRTEEVVDDVKDTGSSIGNFFSSLFGSDDDDNTRKYSTVGHQGTIVTVHASTEDEAERAADILDDNGAVDVDDRASQYGYAGSTTGTGTTGYTDTTTGVGSTGYADTTTGIGTTGTGFADTTTTDYTDTTRPVGLTDGDQTIKVIEEDLQVGKRTVETGGVRVRSRIVARPVEESVRLREERVTVQRTPVNRPATSADLNAFQDGQIELTEHAEVPVVAKTANVVEEISVGKDVTERDELIQDTVRKTEVDVENLTSTENTVRTDRGDIDVTGDTTYSNR